MLDGLRTASQNWIGRIVMGLVMGFIALTFALWGIGDVFRGFSSQRLVKVGGGEVTLEAFRSTYQSELRRLQQRVRRGVTNEEARRAGFDQQVLDRLITDAALDQRARVLGLAMGDEEAQRTIRDEQAFKGPGGKFDPERFKMIVGELGYGERSFMLQHKAETLRKEMTDSVTGGVTTPQMMVEAIHRFRAETRTVEAILLPPAAIAPPPPPSEEEVKKYFGEREQMFRAREYRKLAVLAATSASLAKSDGLTDDEIRAFFDKVKDERYGAAERRDVAQMVFKTQDEAKDALNRLEGGLTMEALTAQRKLSPQDVELGMVTQKDFGNDAVGAAVFALKAPGFAEIAATPFGFVVSQVRKIQPAVYSKTFDQVKDEMRAELAKSRVTPEEIRKLHDAIEDQRASGKSLKEIAAATGAALRDVDFVDDMGHVKNGGTAADLPGGTDLLKAAFASDKGVDNEAVATRDGGYVWFEVADIERARQRSFDEVKGEVEAAMRRDALDKALSAKAAELVGQLRGGKPIDNLAGELGLPIRHIAEVRRANRPDYAPSTILQFFEVPAKGAGAVAIEGGQLIFYVADATTPKFDPAAPESIGVAEQLKPALVNDIYEQFVGGLEKSLNVEINQKLLQNALGGDAEK